MINQHKRNTNSLNTFIPQWRIRQIRWEEAVSNSIIKRQKRNAKIIHSTCHCGNYGCLGIPIILDIK